MECVTCAFTYCDLTPPPAPGEVLCVRPPIATPGNPAFRALLSWGLIFIAAYFTGEVKVTVRFMEALFLPRGQ